MLKIEGLCAGYRGKAVLSGVSLAVAPGEICALLGENGSGKSTLLRAACGLLPAQGGRCTLNGENLASLSARQRAQRVCYVPQRCPLDMGLTALEAVLMGANARTPLLGGYTQAQREEAQACLARAGLEGLDDALCGMLSEGQRQLVVLARALMQRPQLFLLDEPDGALDLTRRFGAVRMLRDAVRETGGCALLSLHDAQLALTACDRVFILQAGRIACALDMRTAGEDEVQRTMRLLYGDVKTCREAEGWAVLAGPGSLHP